MENELDDKVYEAVVRSLEALKHLEGQQGWKLYAAMLEGQKASLMHKVETSLSGEELLRVAGALSMHKIAATWLPSQIAALEKQMKQIVDKARAARARATVELDLALSRPPPLPRLPSRPR